jgi:DNA-directed RNA polymerase sigma subunit (sigma70/sigma32)
MSSAEIYINDLTEEEDYNSTGEEWDDPESEPVQDLYSLLVDAQTAEEEPLAVVPDRPKQKRRSEPQETDIDLLAMSPLQLLMHRAKRYPQLTPLEEISLGRQVRAGLQASSRLEIGSYDSNDDKEHDEQLKAIGASAKHDFICANLKLIAKPARYYHDTHPLAKKTDLLDIYQFGFFGLECAVNKFNPELGYRFSTYALNCIQRFIVRALENFGSTIRVPPHMHTAISAAKRSGGNTKTLSLRKGGKSWEPDPVDIACAELAIGAVSLSQPAHSGQENSNLSLEDTLADPSSTRELLSVLDDEPETDQDDTKPDLVSALEPFLSDKDIQLLDRVMSGAVLNDSDDRQLFKLRSLFRHPAALHTLRSRLGETSLKTIGFLPLTHDDWQSQAACVDKPEIYLVSQKSGPRKERRRTIVQTCGGCLVRPQCRAYLIDRHPERGIWSSHRQETLAKRRQKRREKAAASK